MSPKAHRSTCGETLSHLGDATFRLTDQRWPDSKAKQLNALVEKRPIGYTNLWETILALYMVNMSHLYGQTLYWEQATADVLI